MQDKVFQENLDHIPDFSFNHEVANVFEDMALRSIPFYDEVLRMSAELSYAYYQDNEIIYDLGCSTGKLVTYIQSIFQDKPFQYVGIDLSEAMLAKARKSCLSSNTNQKITFVQTDSLQYAYQTSGVFIANYLFQFIRPMERAPLLRKIFQHLRPGGILVLSEKVLENNSDHSRLFHRLYYDFKKKNGYSELEISQKRDALENVLIPYRVDENIRLLQECGFEHVDIFFKWYNFVSLIATKQA